MRPPVPVSAPGKGATPVGKLWVSAVNRRCSSISVGSSGEGAPGSAGCRVRTRWPRMALELSLKAMTLLLGLASSVCRTMPMRWSGAVTPSMTSRPLKNQWRECSLFDWAMSKHSTLVGLRPSRRAKSSV